jgi:gluconokinase
MVVIVCGVSGAGKTTVGELLAKEMGWEFYEGDDLHPQANIDKMRAGIALTDTDRAPWLQSLRELIERCLAAETNAVLACSALKKSYRDLLRVNDAVKFVFLRGDYSRIEAQLQKRSAHFMKPELLKSQFDTLEEPRAEEGTIVIELGQDPCSLVRHVQRKLRLTS